MAQIYQGDIMNTLSYLLGERTVPSTGTEGRKDFIQQTIKDIYRAYPWKFNEALVTLSVASGLASLPSDFSLNHDPTVWYYTGSGTQTPLDLDNEEDQDAINIGDNKFWLTGYSDDGSYLLNTKEVISSVVVKYQRQAPILAASVGTPFSNTMCVALGARRYYRISQNPEADISQDEALFQKRLQESIQAVQMSAPNKRRKTAQSVVGYSTGTI